MPVKIPTEPNEVVYRDKNGREFSIDQLSESELAVALYDMLQRKARHNHKVNKMFDVADKLSQVVVDIHKEQESRKAPITLEPYYKLQCAADQGTLKWVQTQVNLVIEEDE